ncbi:DUF1045 domain-containing protein [Caldimonas brevitalea]|uniref:Phosphonate metabolism protein n=1 Tax=Caldimonas brevitalea TaxID=413882 RepID=A0A0G3BSN7_9BURK|nr:DUF1045 domain-containing protein [Caldimonas brevitalea]AKJ30391.1 hypothetical protein AAW51_3700 [Caldimonas brevitalea]
MYRYAVYYVPAAEHPLWEAGCAWLRCDPERPDAALRPVSHPVPVGEPARYGFHATLKAPLRLSSIDAESAWLEAVARLASDVQAFEMPRLQVAMLGDFLALQPVEPLQAQHPLRRLADACVTDLDRFRAPPDPRERARRNIAALDARQRELLERYGYPYVLDRWRFHMTLSDGLGRDGDARHASFAAAAREHFAAALSVPLRCDQIAVFAEPEPGAPFRVVQRFALAP